MPATDSQDGKKEGSTPSLPAWDDSSSSHIDDADLFKPGDIVGGSYRILDHIGSGAMGMIYRATHVSLPSEYAVKVLTTNELNELSVLRFQNEAQAIAKLNHPNIIAIYNFGLHDGRLPFYVMDLLRGDNLESLVEINGPMPLELALPIFIEVCAGLNYAHRKGILHRDVKPANFVILDVPDVRGARVKVVDFGLVKFAEQLRPDVQKLTFVGEVCGSPSYMSPEQAAGQKIDPRSDVYSLGCSLYLVLTGKLPFRGRNATETMLMQHEAAVPTLASLGQGKKYGEDLELLAAKMLAKSPMDRYQNMEAVAQDLRNVLDGKPLGTPPPPPVPGPGNNDSIVTAEIPQSPKSRVQGTISSGASPEAIPFKITDAIPGLDRAIRAGPSSPQLDDRSPSSPQLDRRSPSGPKRTPLIAVVLVAAFLLGAGVFFGSKALYPARQASNSAPPVATLIASAGPSRSSPKAIEQIEPNSLDLEGPSGLVGTAPVELTKAQYFSTVVSEDGKQFTEFDFPKPGKGMGLARIGTSLTDSRRTEGKVRFAKDSKLYISPSEGVLNVPQFFEKFRRGEIVGIFITPLNASDELLACATRVPGLSQLLIGHCTKLTAKIIPSLNRLNLSVLDIAGSSIDGAQFAEGHFWQGLKLLNIGNCKNVSPILKQVRGSTNLAILDVSGDQLEVTDYQLIATLPNLKMLNVNSNKLTTEDMHALSGLPKLAAIIAVYTRFTGGLPVEELRHFPALKSLTILRGYLKTTDLQLLKQGCPNLKVLEVSADQMKATGQIMEKDKWDE